MRAEGFQDNGINFTKEEAAELWKSLIVELEKKGYDYELMTSGHFSDEAFLDYLIREHGIKKEKCIFNVNLPETLVEKISSCEAVVSCRLHPSIIAFACGIPSVGIIWNSKVSGFYESIGYRDRAVSTEDIHEKVIVEKLEEAIKQGVYQREEYLMSVYDTLFRGLKGIISADSVCEVWDYGTLLDNLSIFEGTSEEEKLKKLERKFRRTYQSYNKICDQNARNKREIERLKRPFMNRVWEYLRRKGKSRR